MCRLTFKDDHDQKASGSSSWPGQLYAGKPSGPPPSILIPSYSTGPSRCGERPLDSVVKNGMKEVPNRLWYFTQDNVQLGSPLCGSGFVTFRDNVTEHP